MARETSPTMTGATVMKVLPLHAGATILAKVLAMYPTPVWGAGEPYPELDTRNLLLQKWYTPISMALVHGFVKKSRKTPAKELAIARRRAAELRRGG